MRVEYAKALEDFNEITAGYIEKLLKGTTLEDPNHYESGDSLKPSWYLIPDTAGYHFTFGVRIPSGYEVCNLCCFIAKNIFFIFIIAIYGKLEFS